MNQFNSEIPTEVLLSLENTFDKVGIDFYYIIGATAKNIWYSKFQIASRGTRDIDFAILVSDTSQFEKLKELLETEQGFTHVKNNEFAMLSKDGIEIDILPFGEIEVLDGVTIEMGIGLHHIKVNAFKEIGLGGIKEVEENGKRFNLATLPSIILLKLIAYDDRPEHRSKDLQDITDILKHYFKIETNFIYDDHHDLLDKIDLGYEVIAARVIGRSIKKTIEPSPALNTRVTTILEKHIKEMEKSRLIMSISIAFDKPIDEAVNILEEMLQGIRD